MNELRMFLEGNGVSHKQALLRTAYLLNESSDEIIAALYRIPEMRTQIDEVYFLLENDDEFIRASAKLMEATPQWLARGAQAVAKTLPTIGGAVGGAGGATLGSALGGVGVGTLAGKIGGGIAGAAVGRKLGNRLNTWATKQLSPQTQQVSTGSKQISWGDLLVAAKNNNAVALDYIKRLAKSEQYGASIRRWAKQNSLSLTESRPKASDYIRIPRLLEEDMEGFLRSLGGRPTTLVVDGQKYTNVRADANGHVTYAELGNSPVSPDMLNGINTSIETTDRESNEVQQQTRAFSKHPEGLLSGSTNGSNFFSGEGNHTPPNPTVTQVQTPVSGSTNGSNSLSGEGNHIPPNPTVTQSLQTSELASSVHSDTPPVVPPPIGLEHVQPTDIASTVQVNSEHLVQSIPITTSHQPTDAHPRLPLGGHPDNPHVQPHEVPAVGANEAIRVAESDPVMGIAIAAAAGFAALLGLSSVGAISKAIRNKQLKNTIGFEGEDAKKMISTTCINVLKTLQTVERENRPDAIEKGLASAGKLYYMANGQWRQLKDFASLKLAAKELPKITVFKLGTAS
jgi:hypothetical protein